MRRLRCVSVVFEIAGEFIGGFGGEHVEIERVVGMREEMDRAFGEFLGRGCEIGGSGRPLEFVGFWFHGLKITEKMEAKEIGRMGPIGPIGLISS